MPFRELILNNFWWKVTALLLAVGAWYGLSPAGRIPIDLPSTSAGISTRELIAHPVTVSKRADDTREFRVSPSEVDITISSRNYETLKNLDGREIRATVNLTEYTNQTMMPITIYVPEKEKRGLDLVKLFPEKVRVEVVKE